MAQIVVGEDPQPSTYRERHRQARRQEFLDTAREIINRDGLDALTMQAVTAEVGSSSGGIYIYFPNKAALLVELQREALEAIVGSFRSRQSELDEVLATGGITASEAAVARVLAACRHWASSEESFPAEVEMTRRLVTQAPSASDGTRARVLPSVLSLLDAQRQVLDAAVDLGQLEPGNSIERSISMIASVTGVLLASRLGGWDSSMFDGPRLAVALIDDILVGWGADRRVLAAAARHLPAEPVTSTEPVL